jgi:hypothetical protein
MKSNLFTGIDLVVYSYSLYHRYLSHATAAPLAAASWMAALTAVLAGIHVLLLLTPED